MEPSAARDREKEALRIQAAAVAAQQAALTEEESRLEQRRAALEQQEKQLAAHLEEKRQRLITLRDEARRAQAALKGERAAYEQRVANVIRELSETRHDVTESQKQVRAERQRLIDLRQRLKRRWHRHWSAERAIANQREVAVARRSRELDQERVRLQEANRASDQTRLRANGEIELLRRYARADRQQLCQRQADTEKQAQSLAQRESAVAQQERALTGERQRWEARRRQLEEELRGLEARVENQRHRLADQEHGSNRQTTALPAPCPMPDTTSTPSSFRIPVDASQDERAQALLQAERGLQTRLAAVDWMANELMDQRLCLTEECERLALARQVWQSESEKAITDMARLGQSLHDCELALRVREEALERGRQVQEARANTVSAQQQGMEAREARFTAAAARWDGERARLLAQVQCQEESIAQRSASLTRLRETWDGRRRKQIERLRVQRSAWQELHTECAALREEWIRRSGLLAHQERSLANRALALEQLRQEIVTKSANPAAAEKRFKQLRRHWARLAVSAQRALAQERHELLAKAEALDARSRQFQRDAEEIRAQEADLTTRQNGWEQQRIAQEDEQAKSRSELWTLQRQRQYYEQQIAALQEQVERLARILLDSDTRPDLPLLKAA
jgi:hypothetical protein